MLTVTPPTLMAYECINTFTNHIKHTKPGADVFSLPSWPIFFFLQTSFYRSGKKVYVLFPICILTRTKGAREMVCCSEMPYSKMWNTNQILQPLTDVHEMLPASKQLHNFKVSCKLQVRAGDFSFVSLIHYSYSKANNSVSEFPDPTYVFASIAINLRYTVIAAEVRENVFKCIQ